MHPRDPQTPIDGETVRRLLPLLGKGGDTGDDRTLLAELLALWGREHGASGAAVYLDDEPVSPCQATWGEGPFPRHPPAADAGSDGDEAGELSRTALQGGLLLWRARPEADGGAGDGAGESEPSPVELLLGLALANCRLRRRVKRQSFQASYRGVEIEALYDVGLAIASTLDLDALAEEILIRAVSLLDARRGALYLLDGSGYRLQSRFGGTARESFPELEDPEGSQGDGAPDDVLPGAEHRSVAPIAIEDDRRGLLVVADKESRTGVGPFSAEDKRTLALFANQAALALENARLHREALEKERYERDLQLAAEIQRQILPKGVPDVPGFEVVGWNRPAREVGGDFFDFVPLVQEEIDLEDATTRTGPRLGIALADVSGKGVPAALMVSTLHSAIRLLMGRMGVGPALVERLNRHILASSAANKFITLLMAELDAATGELTFVNAGHNPGLVVRVGGEVERLDSGGLPVGLLPGSRYQGGSITLAPGDLLCLYSDGITECVSPEDEELGEERLIELLRSVASEPVAEIVARVDREVTDFAAGQDQFDDQTLVLVRRCAP
jgi:sigma-B regulation protein RsbU (phosphoserine phosphatase)